MDTISACRARDWGPIALIGEYTVPSGPAFDDHFLVVILQDERTSEYPTEKIGEIISELQHVTKSRIELSLCNSTKAASRVIFPPRISGAQALRLQGNALGARGTPAGCIPVWCDRGVDAIDAGSRGLHIRIEAIACALAHVALPGISWHGPVVSGVPVP